MKSSTYTPARDWVLDQLVTRIHKGIYPPNSFIPSQRQLADELRVNRGYIRQAVEELTARGLVRTQQGRGTQVLSVDQRKRAFRIAIVHSPISGWLTHEGMYLATGILDRLAASGHPYTRVTCGALADRLPGPAHISMSVQSKALPALSGEYDGFVFVETGDPEMTAFILSLEERRVPAIVANMEVEKPVSGVQVGHAEAARRAVEILIGYGHTRIAFVGRAPDAYFYGRSLAGYRQAMQGGGLAVDESLIAFASQTSELHAYLASRGFFAREGVPTAVVAARDVLAQGVCHAIEEAGLRVGYDVSVIGFDNVSWAEGQKFLTTFSEPCYEMGTLAVDMLLDRLYGGWRPPERRVLDAPLVLRRSVGPVPLEPLRRCSAAGLGT